MRILQMTTIRVPNKLLTLMRPFWTTNRAVFFDVSTKSTGWAAWDFENKFIRYGALQADGRASALERVCNISAQANRLLSELGVGSCGACIFIEEGVFKSKKVAMLLGEARGAIMAAVRDRAITIQEIGNGEWKKFLRVQADEKHEKVEKVQAHRNIERILGKSVSITHYGKEATYDESDAIGGLICALCTREYYEE